jgi:hypothetical protein
MNIVWVIAAGVAVYYLYRWYDNREPVSERGFTEDLVHDAARWIGPQLQMPAAEAESALRDLMTTGESAELAALTRIDYEVVKESADRALRNVYITLGTGENGQVGLIHRRMSWDSLPEKIRDRFIIGGDRQSFVFYEKPLPQ